MAPRPKSPERKLLPELVSPAGAAGAVLKDWLTRGGLVESRCNAMRSWCP